MCPSLLRRILSILAVSGTLRLRSGQASESRALSVIWHVGFLFCLCGCGGGSWFAKIVPRVAVLLKAGHATAAGGKYFNGSALAVGFDRKTSRPADIFFIVLVFFCRRSCFTINAAKYKARLLTLERIDDHANATTKRRILLHRMDEKSGERQDEKQG